MRDNYYRNEAITCAFMAGVPIKFIAYWFMLSPRTIQRVVKDDREYYGNPNKLTPGQKYAIMELVSMRKNDI